MVLQWWGEKNPSSEWLRDQIKVAVKRNEAAWKDMLRARQMTVKERCMEVCKERNLKMYVYQSKKKSSDQFGTKNESRRVWKQKFGVNTRGLELECGREGQNDRELAPV